MKLDDIIARATEYAGALRASQEAQTLLDGFSRSRRAAEEMAVQLLRLPRGSSAMADALDAAAQALEAVAVAARADAVEPFGAFHQVARDQNALAEAIRAEGLGDFIDALASIIADNAPAEQNAVRIKAHLDRLGIPYEA